MSTAEISRGDVDRLFLQAILSRGVVPQKLAQTLWEKCIAAVNASDDSLKIPVSKDRVSWDGFVSKINISLDKLDLEFRHLHDESSGRELYALVNCKGDEIAQMATDYTPAEIAFFKAVVEQIMLAPRESYSVSSLAALRELSAIKPKIHMTKAQGEVVLSSFVAKGWLSKSKRGRYSLSMRSLLELLPYLKSTYPDDIIECTICMEILTRGIACHTPHCKVRMHYHCFSAYRRGHQNCPSCSNDWPREAKEKPLMAVGEEAAKEADDVKRRERTRTQDGSDESETTEDENREPSQTQTQPKAEGKKKQRSRKSNLQDESMEVEGGESGENDASQPAQRTRRSGRR